MKETIQVEQIQSEDNRFILLIGNGIVTTRTERSVVVSAMCTLSTGIIVGEQVSVIV